LTRIFGEIIWRKNYRKYLINQEKLNIEIRNTKIGLMKNIVLVALLAIITQRTSAQVTEPVHWKFSAQKIVDKTYEVHLTSTIEKPWHIYSQTSPEKGAVPTSITFKKNPIVKMVGKTREVGKIVSKYEDVFGVTVKYFEGNVDFVQVVKLKTDIKTYLAGTISFMVCNDGQCLPPQDEDFQVELK
jgi:thiol:disulfide interchange protein DsbD